MYISVTVHYEMYDGVPILSKWLTVNETGTTGKTTTKVSVYSVEYLAMNQPWSIGGLETKMITGKVDAVTAEFDRAAAYDWMYVETDYSHATRIYWRDDPAEQVRYCSVPERWGLH